MSPRTTGTVLAAAALAVLPGCAYFNTFYNAEQAFAEGERLAPERAAGADLPPAARAAYQKSVEKSSRVLADHPDSDWTDDALLLLAKAHYRLGNHAESSTALRALLREHPESGLRREAMLWMTRVGREAGDYENASRVAEDLLAAGELSGEDRFAVELELAQTALAAGDPDRALEIYGGLRRDDPDLAAANGVDLLAARARLAQGDAAGALGDLRAIMAAEGDPERRRAAALAVAEALVAEGRQDEGREAYRELLEAGVPDSTGAAIRLILAEAHEADGDAAAAAEEFGAAARLVPSTPLAARALYRRGLLEWRALGRRAEAKGSLVEAYLQDPEAEAADSALAAARTIAEMEHYEAIRSGEERVLAPIAPEEVHATATYLLAELVYAQEGDDAAARELFEEILEEHPRSAWAPKVLYTLGWLAQQEGQAGREEALERYATIEREHPATEYARYAAARRSEIRGLDASVPDFGGAAPDSAAADSLAPDLVAPDLVAHDLVAADSIASDSMVFPEPASGEPGAVASADLLPLPPSEATPARPAPAAEAPPPAPASPTSATPTDAAAPRAPAIDADALAEAGATRDEVLLILSRALPRPPDPLVGLEDRLGARRRAAEERGLTPGEIERRLEERANAQPDSAAGPFEPAAGADPADGTADETADPGDGRVE